MWTDKVPEYIFFGTMIFFLLFQQSRYSDHCPTLTLLLSATQFHGADLVFFSNPKILSKQIILTLWWYRCFCSSSWEDVSGGQNACSSVWNKIIHFFFSFFPKEPLLSTPLGSKNKVKIKNKKKTNKPFFFIMRVTKKKKIIVIECNSVTGPFCLAFYT